MTAKLMNQYIQVIYGFYLGIEIKGIGIYHFPYNWQS